MAEKFKFAPRDVSELKNEYDLIIIGSGAAGLTSAIQAKELGLKPIILEKMDKLGGNSTRASSGMNAAETLVQLKHNVVDSFDDFYEETYVGGGKLNNTELLRYFSNHAASSVEWLADHKIFLEDITITGGMSKMRTHRPASMAPIGAFLVTELLKQIKLLDIPLFAGVNVKELLLDTEQKICGMKVVANGAPKKIITKAIILATGGFGANQDMLVKYRPDLKGYKTTNQPGATGDGIKLAQKVGAKVVDMDQIQIHPTVQQDNDHAYLIGEAVRGEGAILVNKAGKRFVNELDEGGAYLIFDKSIRDRVKAVEFYASIGLVKTEDSLGKLALENELDERSLVTTIEEWNKSVETHNDFKFGRKTGMDRSIKEEPYNLIHIAPAVHYTMGGVGINSKTEVLTDNNSVIAGLYACGEIVGGLHGNNRIGGNSIAETVIFGRQSGQQVFNYLR